MSLRQRLRAWWRADERLGALESGAQAAAERSAAVERSLADTRLELERHQARAAAELAAASAELRGVLDGMASGLRALEERLSLLDAEERRRAAEQRAREDEHRAGEARHEAGLRGLEEQLRSVQGDLAREMRAGVERLHHVLGHHSEQLDLLKSSLEVDAALIEEYERWKAGHPLSDRPLVSVCIATYNRAQLLAERCLPSVLGQSYPHLEVLVVGDGCTDDTAERVGAISDPRLRFVNRERRGDYPSDSLRRWMVAGTPAVNEALAQAKGELITHLDDDDEYLPERIEKLVAFIRDEGGDLVWHPFWYEDPAGRWLLNEAGAFAFSRVTTSSVLYRSWFKKIPWDAGAHRLMEPGDWNRFRRLRYVGSVFRRFPEPLLRHYRERRPGSAADAVRLPG
jgi:hypothetical protein